MTHEITEPEFRAIARQVLSDCRYLTLATSAGGQPWATPLMYAFSFPYLYWVGAVDSQHSRNIEANASVGAVIFDTHPTPGQAQALYLTGSAERVLGEALADGCGVFYAMRYPDPVERTEKGRGPADFTDPSPRGMWRMQLATASVLDPRKHPEFGSLVDHRVSIPLEFLA